MLPSGGCIELCGCEMRLVPKCTVREGMIKQACVSMKTTRSLILNISIRLSSVKTSQASLILKGGSCRFGHIARPRLSFNDFDVSCITCAAVVAKLVLRFILASARGQRKGDEVMMLFGPPTRTPIVQRSTTRRAGGIVSANRAKNHSRGARRRKTPT